jgi:hypothetical protein
MLQCCSPVWGMAVHSQLTALEGQAAYLYTHSLSRHCAFIQGQAPVIPVVSASLHSHWQDCSPTHCCFLIALFHSAKLWHMLMCPAGDLNIAEKVRSCSYSSNYLQWPLVALIAWRLVLSPWPQHPSEPCWTHWLTCFSSRQTICSDLQDCTDQPVVFLEIQWLLLLVLISVPTSLLGAVATENPTWGFQSTQAQRHSHLSWDSSLKGFSSWGFIRDITLWCPIMFWHLGWKVKQDIRAHSKPL